MKRIVVLGSTGSIGTQTLDVVRRHADKLEVVGLAVGTRTGELLAQAREFGVRHLAVGDERLAEQPIADELRNAILSGSHGGTQQPASAPSSLAEAVARHNAGGEGSLGFGADAVVDLVRLPEADIVVNALVGAAGLRASYETLAAGRCWRSRTRSRSWWAATSSCRWPPSRGASCPSIPSTAPSTSAFWAKTRARCRACG